MTAGKTVPELTAETPPIVGTDELVVYRAPGPLKRVTASVLGTYVNTVIGTAFTRTLLDDPDAATARTTLAAVGTADLAASTGAALVGSIQTGTGVAARTVQAKLRDIYSVKDFGVVGDGTDETTEIQAAIDAVEALNGGRLYFPPCSSSYGFTNLTVGHRVILCGEGFTEFSGQPPSSYLKRVTGSTGVGITITGDASGFENMHVDGNDCAGDLVQVLGGRFVLRDTSLVQAGQDGLRIGTDSTSHSYNMNLWRVFNLVSLDHGRYGVYVHDADAGGTLNDTNVNNGLLVGCDIRSCVNHGIYINKGWDCNFYGVACQNNTGTGLRYGALSKNITAIHPYLEGNGNNEFVADSGGVFGRVIGNRSGVNSSGYVDNTTDGVDMLQTRSGIAGFYHNKVQRIANFASGGSASLELYADTDEVLAGLIQGRAGPGAGSDGRVAVQVKRTGNTPIDRFIFDDGEVGPAANTKFVIPTSQTPASAAATGTTGTIAWDTSYIYVCTATDTWKRVAIATW
jgi:hypothetical protein